MSDDELAGLCALWQKRLRLQDWDVTARFVGWHEADNGMRTGHVDWLTEKRVASILIVREAEANPSNISPYDAETTLVHELLHLHLAGMNVSDNTPEAVAEEQAIHALSCALVNLARQIPPDEGC